MDVTDVLRDRLQEPSGLQRMMTLSALAHAVFASILILAPGALIPSRTAEPATVMTISLGGAGDGPNVGGGTPAATRAVQTVVPPEELTKRDAFTPPAATRPEMVPPAVKPVAKPSKTPPPPAVREAPDAARGRTPTKGAQKAFGEALTYTGARGQGFGLSTGGGPGTGSTLDVSDFCCPEYIATMIDRVRSVWQQNQGASGSVLVKFTIHRDGRLADVEVERGSGNTLLDTAAQRAVLQTRTLNPLPAQFSNPTLTVHLNFQYQ